MVINQQPKKIAILGGGMGALTTAFELTNQANWRNEYQITLYQVGWRLGGKGASGRNLNSNARIEEHGLHIFMGMYENTFRLLRQCYDELGRNYDSPLATWSDAFKPHSFVAFPEQINDNQWSLWAHDFPRNDLLPGDGHNFPTVSGYVEILIGFMIDQLKKAAYLSTELFDHDEHSSVSAILPPWLLSVLDQAHILVSCSEFPPAVNCLYLAHQLVKALPLESQTQQMEQHQAILWLLQQFRDWLEDTLSGIMETHQKFRRLYVMVDLATAAIRGIIVDRLILDGFDLADEYDFQEWLRKHGALDTSVNAPVVRGMYDLVFGYEQGDVNRPSLAAGSALRNLLRCAFCYRGTFFWKMQAGMGDTIFAPLYEVLKRRGVVFKFFHSVKNLGLSEDKASIKTIQIGRQATLRLDEYDPLVTIKGLPCWPSAPLYEQLVEGDTLKTQAINLESSWTSWHDQEDITLQSGEDFDEVILGIPLGALGHICPELIAAREDWQMMLDQVKTVQTQALQVWLKPNLSELGWRMPSAVVDAYIHPLNTWADMSHLSDVEDWPKGQVPGHIAYFCGPLADAEVIPNFGEIDFPKQEDDRVKAIAKQWFERNTAPLWPKIMCSQGPERVNWDLLLGPEQEIDSERFDCQFWKANIEPSDRYVMSTKGSTKYRLQPDQSGFNNLYLAGDWTRNPLNLGCIEATVMSGMKVSQAISGYPAKILGDSDV